MWTIQLNTKYSCTTTPHRFERSWSGSIHYMGCKENYLDDTNYWGNNQVLLRFILFLLIWYSNTKWTTELLFFSKTLSTTHHLFHIKHFCWMFNIFSKVPFFVISNKISLKMNKTNCDVHVYETEIICQKPPKHMLMT